MGGRVKRQLYLFIPLFHLASSIHFCNKFLTKKGTFGSNMKIANLCILVTILTTLTIMIMVIIINIMSVQEANPLICFSVNNPPSPAGCSAHHHHPPCASCYHFHLHHRQSTTHHHQHQHHHLPCASHYHFLPKTASQPFKLQYQKHTIQNHVLTSNISCPRLPHY